MLTRLSIRDIVLIDRLDLDFTSGLSVLTGETGAGKSILLDAFALALGARGDAALVREGAEHGQVTAAFELKHDHPVRAVMAANDIAAEDELILRRAQFADGRTRAFINDQPVSVQALKLLGTALVEIHGQHDERALVDPAIHRRLLDAFGDIVAAAEGVARLWDERRARETALIAHRAEVERVQREADWLRHAVAELAELAPRPAEEAALAERRTAMMQTEKIAGDLRDAHEAVAGAARSFPPWSSRRSRRSMPACRPSKRRGRISNRRCASPIMIRRSWNGSRSGCLRCALPPASTMFRWTSLQRSPFATRPTSAASMPAPPSSASSKPLPARRLSATAPPPLRSPSSASARPKSSIAPSTRSSSR
jgi:hypothetical protein